jgi:hypothetical protein
MILLLIYFIFTPEPDDFEKANRNLDSYHETCIKIALNPEAC